MLDKLKELALRYEDLDQQALADKLAAMDYHYDPERNQFV